MQKEQTEDQGGGKDEPHGEECITTKQPLWMETLWEARLPNLQQKHPHQLPDERSRLRDRMQGMQRKHHETIHWTDRKEYVRTHERTLSRVGSEV